MSRITTAGLIAAFALALAGCESVAPTELDRHWGSAYRDNKAQMIANPAAGELNREPVEGLDPATAEGVMENHRRREAQTRPAGQTPSIINIGTSSR